MPDRSKRDSQSVTETNVTPRWVKVFGVIALVVVLMFIILMFTRGPGGRGEHSPLRHFGGQGDR